MKTMCNDKEYRERLVERYLKAETTVEEERVLAQFYREAAPESLSDEERQVARLLQFAPEVQDEELDMDDVAEFDRLFPAEKKQLWRRRWLPAMGAAAAVLLVAAWALLKPATSPENEFDIMSFTALCESVTEIFPDASSINIERSGDSLLVTVRHENGNALTFFMEKESLRNDGVFSLKAVTRK